MDEDWALILPAMLVYGLRCWALAWYGAIRNRP